MAGLLYITSGFLTAFTPFYSLLLLGRMGLGTAAAGGKFTSLTLLTENVDSVHRAGMSVAFHFSYPAGMFILALLAYFVHPWRDLQLGLSIPSLFLFLHF
jgi:MFS family permease